MKQESEKTKQEAEIGMGSSSCCWRRRRRRRDEKRTLGKHEGNPFVLYRIDCILWASGRWDPRVRSIAPSIRASKADKQSSLCRMRLALLRIANGERERAAAMATMRAAAAASLGLGLGPGALSSSVFPRRFLSLSSTSRARDIHRHLRLRAFPGSELTLEELNPSVDLLRKTAEAVGDFRKTPIYIVGTDCTAKRNIAKLLANSIIYRYLCSEDLLEDVLGGKDALNAFRESDKEGYLQVETEGLKQLTSMGSLVLCCGDGAVMNSTNLGLLRHGVSIWINVPLEMAVNDILKAQATSDPDSFSEAMGTVRQRYDELKERYGVSDFTVSVQNVASQLGYSSIDSVTLEDMVLEIVRQIEKLIRAKSMMEAAGKPL